MERVALQNLIDWNNNPRRKPLIVWGARQVGKTYLVQELFAEQFYKNKYLYIDFKKEDEIRSFCHETANAEKIIEYISLRKGKIIDENTAFLTTTLTTLSVANTFVNADFIYTVVCSVLVFCFFNFCKRAKYSPPDAS